KDKAPVLDAAKEVFQDLEEIDVAAAANDKLQATNEYTKAIADFDTFFSLIPKSN
ncbi:MAG: photosystem II protein PsbQ, partial [Okeania sp. SIO4D6]|nr:photosystem II protein PsbQ [Okeania sp. SIO4D6]